MLQCCNASSSAGCHGWYRTAGRCWRPARPWDGVLQCVQAKKITSSVNPNPIEMSVIPLLRALWAAAIATMIAPKRPANSAAMHSMALDSAVAISIATMVSESASLDRQCAKPASRAPPGPDRHKGRLGLHECHSGSASGGHDCCFSI